MGLVSRVDLSVAVEAAGVGQSLPAHLALNRGLPVATNLARSTKKWARKQFFGREYRVSEGERERERVRERKPRLDRLGWPSAVARQAITLTLKTMSTSNCREKRVGESEKDNLSKIMN